MTRQALINQIKALIIDTASPSRIWLYGSEALGTALPQSDIDIAYWRDKDPQSQVLLAKINQQLQSQATLIKVDVVDLSLVDERFLNRVKSTGKVLYSASKALRAEDALFNFARALRRLNLANEQFRSGDLAEDLTDIYVDVLVKRFEFTFEMSWKAMQRLLSFKGIEANNPRACFREAFQQQWINNESTALSMIEMRNTTAHTYDLSSANEILHKIGEYIDAFRFMFVQMELALNEDLEEH